VLKGKVTRYLEPSSPLYVTGTIHEFILLKGKLKKAVHKINCRDGCRLTGVITVL
jgi:hypothetical protein